MLPLSRPPLPNPPLHYLLAFFSFIGFFFWLLLMPLCGPSCWWRVYLRDTKLQFIQRIFGRYEWSNPRVDAKVALVGDRSSCCCCCCSSKCQLILEIMRLYIYKNNFQKYTRYKCVCSIKQKGLLQIILF